MKICQKNLPAVLYGCESGPLTLKEDCRMRMFEKRALKRIFGPKRGKWLEKTA
jgi:hypothetical protein